MPSNMPRRQELRKEEWWEEVKERQRERNWDKQYRISRKNTIAMAKPGIMTLLNLTVVHYGLAFLNDWLLSLLMFSFLPLIFSSPLRHSSLDTQRHKNNVSQRRSAIDLEVFFSLSLCFSSNRNCTSLIVYKNVLWTQWGTLTWFMPPTDAPALFICQCFENTLFFFFPQLFHVPDTSTVAHQNPALLPSPKAMPLLE